MAKYAKGAPINTEIPTKTINSLDSNCVNSETEAPSTLRTPISFVR